MTATFDIAALTPKERLDLIGELWDNLAPDDVRLTPVQDAKLVRRMSPFDADVKNAVPFEMVETELDRRTR